MYTPARASGWSRRFAAGVTLRFCHEIVVTARPRGQILVIGFTLLAVR